MNTRKCQLENYKKFLLTRATIAARVVDYIENCLSSEDTANQHSFHKIMVHNWSGSSTELFETLTAYFVVNFIPINYSSQEEITTFYTSNLNLIVKITKFDFMFPHQRNMFNIDILFNDKSSTECLSNQTTVEDIVAGVVSNRLSENFELNLSNLCNDSEFESKKIHFYNISILCNFKLLMLRMGRETKILNLSHNNLSQVPVNILNFFMKGDLIAIDLSNNNIPSITEMHRVSSKIEKFWLEGNPLCEDIDPVSYAKLLLMKFPRLTQLDGVKINEHGIVVPFHKNFLAVPDQKTKMLVEKFLFLFFAHYDKSPRDRMDKFYDNNATLSIATKFSDAEEKANHIYVNHGRNIINAKRRPFGVPFQNSYKGVNAIHSVFNALPESIHDPSTFTVDVLWHDNRHFLMTVDGLFKENNENQQMPEKYFIFRRTFLFRIQLKSTTIAEYNIINELMSISVAPKELIDSAFKHSKMSYTNPLALKNPDQQEVDAICNIFSHLTQLKRANAEKYLKAHFWDITKALQEFLSDVQSNRIAEEKFIDDKDDFSDSSSLIEE